jgi:hypothetical protein
MIDVLISELKNALGSPIIASAIIFVVQHQYIGRVLLVTLAFPKDMIWHPI